MSRYAAPAAILLTLLTIWSVDGRGETVGFAVAALVCWGIALAFEE